MLYDHKTRKAKVLEAVKMEDEEARQTELKTWMCPFFREGEYSACHKCKQDEYELNECVEYFLDRVTVVGIDVYEPKFDLPINKRREKKKLEDFEDEIGMTCNSCFMAEKCPVYEKHATCGIDFGDVPQSNTEKVDALINMQYVRVKRASTFEQVDGGVPDTNLSTEMDRLTNLIAFKDDMGREKLTLSMEAKGASAGAAGGGILAKLFGGGSTPTPAETSSTEDVVHIDVSEDRALPPASTTFIPDNSREEYETVKRPSSRRSKKDS